MVDKVAVLILNYNGRHFLEDCLSAVMRQTYSDYRVVVIDNGSTDGSVDFVRTRFPDVGLIENDRNLLFAGGNNVGLAQLAFDYPFIVLLNNDTVVASTWLEELVRPAYEPQVGIVTSTIKERSGRYYGWSLNVWTGTIVGNQSPPPDQTIFPVFHASGCSMLIKSAVLQQVGLLDDDYGCYFEDVDLCWRVWLAGYQTICNSQALVEHLGGGTSQKSPRSLGLAERNRLLTYYKNLEPATLARVFPVMLICRLVLAIVVRRDRAILRGIADGLCRIPAYGGKRAAVQSLRRVSDRQILALSRPASPSRLWRLLREARHGNAKSR
jgi:GT2 family glycosyltransferase